MNKKIKLLSYMGLLFSLSLVTTSCDLQDLIGNGEIKFPNNNQETNTPDIPGENINPNIPVEKDIFKLKRVYDNYMVQFNDIPGVEYSVLHLDIFNPLTNKHYTSNNNVVSNLELGVNYTVNMTYNRISNNNVSEKTISEQIYLPTYLEYDVPNLESIPTKERHISIWVGGNSGLITNMQQQFKDFTNKYNISVDFQSFKTPGNVINQVNLKKNHLEELPDVIMGYSNNFAQLISDDLGLPLNNYMNSNDINISLKDDFLNGYLDNSKCLNNELIFSIPFQRSQEVAYYNKTLFDEFDIPLPKTYNEMDEIGNNLLDKIRPYLGSTYQCKKSNYVINFPTEDKITPFLINNPEGRIYDSTIKNGHTSYCDGKPNHLLGTTNFDKQFIDDMQEYRKIGKNLGITHEIGYKYANLALDDFVSFYAVDQAVSDKYYYLNNKYEVGVCKAPDFYDSQGKTSHKVYSRGCDLGLINKQNPNSQLLSWLLIKYLTEGDGPRTPSFINNVNDRHFPLHYGDYEDPFYFDIMNNSHPVYKVLKQYVDEGYSYYSPSCNINSHYDDFKLKTYFDKIIYSEDNIQLLTNNLEEELMSNRERGN